MTDTKRKTTPIPFFPENTFFKWQAARCSGSVHRAVGLGLREVNLLGAGTITAELHARGGAGGEGVVEDRRLQLTKSELSFECDRAQCLNLVGAWFVLLVFLSFLFSCCTFIFFLSL